MPEALWNAPEYVIIGEMIRLTEQALAMDLTPKQRASEERYLKHLRKLWKETINHTIASAGAAC